MMGDNRYCFARHPDARYGAIAVLYSKAFGYSFKNIRPLGMEFFYNINSLPQCVIVYYQVYRYDGYHIFSIAKDPRSILTTPIASQGATK
jgi:hypothetical protein